MARTMTKRSMINPPSPFDSRVVIRYALVISFILHVILSFAFQRFLPSPWSWEKLRSYKVELIRTPVEDMDRPGSSDAEIARLKEHSDPIDGRDVETISLDTEDKRYTSYARVIKERILRRWAYPPEAKKDLIQGRVLAIFSLGRDGKMIQVVIAGSSGYEILDGEVIRAIRSADPFPPFPEHVTVKRLNIKALFDYRFTTKK